MGEIETVAIIGGGGLARTIALVAARGGYRTIVQNILPANLRQAGDEVRAGLERAVQLGRISQAEAVSVLHRVEYVATVEEAARPADLVIEAVPDEIESKLEIFTLLDKICRPHTILACTTSFLSVSEIASVTYRDGQILGMRFPGSSDERLRLELVRGRETNDATVTACVEFGRQMDLEVVVVAEGESGG